MTKNPYTIILFYKFNAIKNPETFKLKQRKIAEAFGLRGRMLIATEGVNATFEGETKNIKGYIKKLRESSFATGYGATKQNFFKDVVFKDSVGNGKAFTKLMVKTRPEVVTLGVGSLNIKKDTAPVLTAAQFDKLYKTKQDFVVLDLRNNYEVEAGYFEKTVNPNLKNFRDLPGKLPELAHLKDKKVVAVCTGGIRCEKATVLLKKEGFKNIYQLKDGIHAYMKKYPGKHFKGSLFVFDNRMITPVVEDAQREVVGQCKFCGATCEQFYNDDSIRPSRKVICCDVCIMRHKKLRPAIPV